jgi:pimeloyl-ACP methyl ester carboxylesterase
MLDDASGPDGVVLVAGNDARIIGFASGRVEKRREDERLVVMPMAHSRMMGLPKGYELLPEEAETMAGMRKLLFPFKPRRDGAVFDGFVSNLAADRFPFEQLTVPTLVVHARDDHLAPCRFAAAAASRIRGAKLVTIERGGHMFMGHDNEVREAIRAFVQPLM